MHHRNATEMYCNAFQLKCIRTAVNETCFKSLNSGLLNRRRLNQFATASSMLILLAYRQYDCNIERVPITNLLETNSDDFLLESF